MKFLTNLDLLQNQLLNAVAQKLSTAPLNPVAGQIYFNTQSKRLFVYNGSEWAGADALDASMTGGDIVTAINAQGEKISLVSIDVGVFSTSKDGLVPKTTTSNTTDYLRKDGSWATPPDTTTTINGKTGAISKSDIVALGIPEQDTTYPPATTSANGLMTSADKSKLDGIEVNANKTTIVDNLTSTSGTSALSANQGKVLKDALDTKETPAGAQSKATAAENAAKLYADSVASVAGNSAKDYVDQELAALVGTAPEVLDTLEELADALGGDANFATTMTQELAKKTDKKVQAVGDGSATSFEITHNFNTRDLIVSIRETGSPYAQVYTDIEMTTTNTITVKFAVAPASNAYTVTIVG